MRLRIALGCCAGALAACSAEPAPRSPLTDTLLFPPGTAVQFKGEPAKLYGNSTCHVGGLIGKTCVLLAPTRPTASATIVGAKRAYEVTLSARRDPKNPATYVIEDAHGEPLLSTHGEENLLDFILIGL